MHGCRIARAALAACPLAVALLLIASGAALAADSPPSRWAHRGESREQALTTAKAHFREAVTTPWTRPPGASPGERVVRYLDANTVQLEVGRSRRPLLVESMQPLRGADATGRKVPVDLLPTRQGSRWRPAAPAVPLTIADDVADGVTLDDLGLTITPVLASSTSPELSGETLFWGNAATDTDWLATPIRAGVETFAQLRSPDSPEALTMRFASDKGPVVLARPAPALRDPIGAVPVAPVDVVVAGRTVARVQPPTADDADGKPVEVSYSLAGDELTMHVAHRDAPVTYPVLVDPQVVDSNVSSTQGWFADWSPNDTWLTFFDGGSYLAIQGTGGHAYTEDHAVAWEYQAGRGLVNGTGITGNTAYIFQGYTKGMSCCQFSQGQMFDATATRDWDTAHYPKPQHPATDPNGSNDPYWQGYYNDGSGSGGQREPNRRNNDANGTLTVQHCPYALCNPESGVAANFGNKLVWGARFTGTATPCCSNIYAVLSGADIYLDDAENPTITSAAPADVNWTKQATLNAAANTEDINNGLRGLGIRELRLTGPGAQPGTTLTRSALAPIEGQTDTTKSCTGTYAKRCRQAWDFANNPISYSTDELAEGDNIMTLTAYDAPGKASGASTFHVKVDRSKPLIDVTGPAFDSRDNLDGGGWDLEVHATDGSPTAPQSGVERIDFSISDAPGQADAQEQVDCSGDSCDLDAAFTVDADSLAQGTHTVTVTATDKAGNTSEPTSFTITTRSGPSSARCTGAPNYDVYNAGDAVDGLPVSYAYRTCQTSTSTRLTHHSVTYVYGSCTPPDVSEDSTGCPATLQITSSPLCQDHAELYRLPDGSVLPYVQILTKGVPGASYDTGVTQQLYTGGTAITVNGEGPDIVQHAVDALRPVVSAANIPDISQPLAVFPVPDPNPVGSATLPAPDATTLDQTSASC